MSIFKFIRKIMSKLLKKFSKKNKAITKMESRALIDYNKFNSNQIKVIEYAIESKVDYKRVAKTKYEAEQMLVLSYGLVLGLDISNYESYAIPALEMEYQMYMQAVDKFLGKNYLKTLLNGGIKSVLDREVKERIEKDLTETVQAYLETAVTMQLENEDMVSQKTEENETYELLLKMCEDRDMDSSSITRGSVHSMIYDYSVLEKQYTQKISTKSVMYKRLKNSHLQPDLYFILNKDSVLDRKEPIKIYSNGKCLGDYYQMNGGNHIYLYKRKSLTFQLK